MGGESVTMQLIRFFEISEMNDHARHTAVRADKNNGALQHGVATSVRKAWATPKVIVGALVDDTEVSGGTGADGNPNAGTNAS
jgi:hypothetical protein